MSIFVFTPWFQKGAGKCAIRVLIGGIYSKREANDWTACSGNNDDVLTPRTIVSITLEKFEIRLLPTPKLETMAKPKAKPLGLKWRSSTVFIVGTVAISLFTDLFLYGLVVPILPFILQDRIHLPEDQIQSHVSGLLAAYAAASVIFSPPAGIIADKVSARQLPFLAGLTALLTATVIFSLGKSVAVLAIARVLQGISAAFVWTVGLTLVLDTVGPDNLGKTVGSVCHRIGNMSNWCC